MHSNQTRRRSALGFRSSAALAGFCWVSFSLHTWAQPCEPEFAGNWARGQQIATKLCAACHGADGRGMSAQFPSLAAQFPEYLVKQLKAFRAPADGKPLRTSEVMTPIPPPLPNDDFTAAPAYSSTLHPTGGP